MSIDLIADEDQRELAAAAREMFARQLPDAHALAIGTDPFPDELWSVILETGLLATSVPEPAGGLGAGTAEEVLVLAEAGRRLVPGPLRSTLLAVRVALAAGDDTLVAGLLEGERRAGLALDGGRVLEGRPGDLAVVLTDTGAELRDILSASPIVAVDPTARLADARLGVPVAKADGPFRAIARAHAAAEVLGVIDELTQISADYARTRVQFGKPIGSFQAVKHRCSEMVVSAISLRAQVNMAAVLLDSGAPDAGFHAAAAFRLASERGRRTAEDTIQNLGGIGFTWEHSAHLYLTRAVLLSKAYGSRASLDADLTAPLHHPFH